MVIIFLSLCLPNLIICCGDIEKNPGPKYSSLKFCQKNLNSPTAHYSIKISLIQVYKIQNNYDMFIRNVSKFFNSN